MKNIHPLVTLYSLELARVHAASSLSQENEYEIHHPAYNSCVSVCSFTVPDQIIGFHYFVPMFSI